MEQSARTHTVALDKGAGWWYRDAQQASGGNYDFDQYPELADPAENLMFEQSLDNRFARYWAQTNKESDDDIEKAYGVRPKNTAEWYQYARLAPRYREYQERRDIARNEQLLGWGRDPHEYVDREAPRRTQADEPGNVDIMNDRTNRRLEVYRQRVDLEAQRHVGPGGLPEELLQRIFPDEQLKLPGTHPAYNRQNAQHIRDLLAHRKKRK